VSDDSLVAGFSFRSPIADMLDQNIAKVQLLADVFDLEVEFTSRYPGYPYDEHSPLRTFYQQWLLSIPDKSLNLTRVMADWNWAS
jgi:di/tripeptidase